MGDEQTTWDKLATYVGEMAELTADAIQTEANRFGKAWNKAAKGKFGAKAQSKHVQKSMGAGLEYSGKAFAKTRDLMLGIAGVEPDSPPKGDAGEVGADSDTKK